MKNLKSGIIAMSVLGTLGTVSMGSVAHASTGMLNGCDPAVKSMVKLINSDIATGKATGEQSKLYAHTVVTRDSSDFVNAMLGYVKNGHKGSITGDQVVDLKTVSDLLDQESALVNQYGDTFKGAVKGGSVKTIPDGLKASQVDLDATYEALRNNDFDGATASYAAFVADLDKIHATVAGLDQSTIVVTKHIGACSSGAVVKAMVVKPTKTVTVHGTMNTWSIKTAKQQAVANEVLADHQYGYREDVVWNHKTDKITSAPLWPVSTWQLIDVKITVPADATQSQIDVAAKAAIARECGLTVGSYGTAVVGRGLRTAWYVPAGGWDSSTSWQKGTASTPNVEIAAA